MKCLSEETLQKIQNNFNNLNKLENSVGSIQQTTGPGDLLKPDFLLNYNNYNIIKNQVDLFKNLPDDQIICLLERNDNNFCDNFNNGISTDSFLKLSNNIKSVHQILNLYQNQILDIKNIILPRFLSLINKCKNITKENKLKVLNMFRHILYNVEYISYFIGNNWDLIKKIDQTIKSLNS